MKTKGSMMRGKILLLVFFLILAPNLLLAQQYPAKPINLLLGFAPGGIMDVSTRVLASKAEKFLGQRFVISNNGAAAGTVALSLVAKEKPDGYNLVGCTSSGLTIIPRLRPVSYSLESFTPIMHFVALQLGVVVRADSPWNTLKDLIEYARKNPGKVTYSSPGLGTSAHLVMEHIAKKEGIQWSHVPCAGDAPALTALLGGHVSAESGASTWIPHVLNGTLRVLVTNGEKRMKNFPNVPVFHELGYTFIDTLFLIAAPKGTPLPIVTKLDDALHRAMAEPEFIEAMSKLEVDITYRNAADTKKHLEVVSAALGPMIEGLKK